MASCGSPVGTFLLAPLIRGLCNTYGWRGAFIILAAISLNMGVASSLFRPIRLAETEKEPELSLIEGPVKKKKKVIRVKVLCRLSFLCLLINNLSLLFGFSSFYMHLPAYLKTTGLSEDFSAIFISICGAAGMVGRLFAVQIAQKLDASIKVYNAAATVAGFCILLTPFIGSSTGVSIICALFGVSSASTGSALPLVITELVGLDSMSDGYGYILIAEGIGTLLGPPITGNSSPRVISGVAT